MKISSTSELLLRRKTDRREDSYTPPKLKRAQLHCLRIALSHYENFFVLGPLTPLRLTPHLASLYAFARHADDLADETEDSREALKLLDAWQQELQYGLDGHPKHRITRALIHTVAKYNLPPKLLFDLIVAFKQDLSSARFETFDILREYTRRSADPVGRLVLRIYGFDDPELDSLSDNICTGLQLANFCQDIGEDARRNRIYIPLDECRRFDVDPVKILDCTPSASLEGLLRFQIVRAYKFLIAGLPLTEKLHGRIKFSTRLFALGGLQILEELRQNPLSALYSQRQLTMRKKMRALFSSFRPIRKVTSIERPPQFHPV